MESSKQKGPRVIGAIIILLIILFFAIEFFIRETQQFSPTTMTRALLTSLQIIVLLLFLVLLFVLGRNLIKLFLERKRKVAGAQFKTKLLLFFIALSLVPTLLLFIFASDLVRRNIEQWFRTPIDKILSDTKSLADGFYLRSEEITLHYAREMSRAIQEQNLITMNRRQPLMDFVRKKLKEYQLDEIGIYLDDEELFSYLNPDLPLQDYRDLTLNIVKRAQLGEKFKRIDSMGNGEMVRTGESIQIPDVGNLLVVTGKFLPQSYAQRIENISAYVERYKLLKIQKNPVQNFYFLTLIFVTLLIIFAASWLAFQLAKGITVPIEKLAKATKEVSKGNLDVRVESPASDEVGILVESFNQMIMDLKESRHNIALKASELAARKQYIETILNSITTGVITLSANGVITTINPSAKKMLGLKEKNLVGANYSEVLHGPEYAEIVTNIERGLKRKSPLSNKEIKLNINDQSAVFALTLSMLRRSDNEFTGMIVVLEDLTQLIKAQKIVAWKEVAQRVAHEIKNPLTPIQLSAERIIKNLQQDGRDRQKIIKEGANTIVQEAGTIKSLVDEFSSFARMPSVKLQSANIHDIIDHTISLFEGIFADIEFDTQYARDVPTPIQIDSEQMKRVFINLFDNAIDAMNKKGKIRVDTAFNKQLQSVRIEVSDTGPGISLKDKERLFLPHFSTKSKGSGLGLAIVDQVITEHDGSIEVENNKPYGAKFIIQIPV